MNSETGTNTFHFLSGQHLGTACTVGKSGKPDGSSVYYVIDENFDIFFLTKIATEKYKNIQHLRDVVFIVTDVTKNMTAKIKGVASFIFDEQFIEALLGRLAEKLNEDENFNTTLPILKRGDSQLVVVKIEPVQIRMSLYGESTLKETELRF